MSICAFATHDTHCHLLLGLKSLDISKEASQAAALDAVKALGDGVPLPKLLHDDELHSEEIERMVRSFLSSEVQCFDFYSTCYKDAKLSYEVLSAYKDAFAHAGKTAHLGVGLHPYWLTEDYTTELNALCALIEHIHIASPHLLVSLGEIGLDKRLELSMETQCRFMQEFISRTAHYNLPYSCHCVRAYNEIDRVLSAFQSHKSQRKAAHCANSSAASSSSTVSASGSPTASVSSASVSASAADSGQACVSATSVSAAGASSSVSADSSAAAESRPQLRAIIHGFNGSVGTAKTLLSKGYSLGIGKSILSETNHKKFEQIIEIAQHANEGLGMPAAVGAMDEGLGMHAAVGAMDDGHGMHAAVGAIDDGHGAASRGNAYEVIPGLLGLESDYDGSGSAEYEGQMLRLIYEGYTRLSRQ